MGCSECATILGLCISIVVNSHFWLERFQQHAILAVEVQQCKWFEPKSHIVSEYRMFVQVIADLRTRLLLKKNFKEPTRPKVGS